MLLMNCYIRNKLCLNQSSTRDKHGLIKNANKQKLKLSVHFEILEEVIQWKIELGMLNSANSTEKLLTRKSDCYKTEMKNKMINSVKDPKTFWSTLKKNLF